MWYDLLYLWVILAVLGCLGFGLWLWVRYRSPRDPVAKNPRWYWEIEIRQALAWAALLKLQGPLSEDDLRQLEALTTRASDCVHPKNLKVIDWAALRTINSELRECCGKIHDALPPATKTQLTDPDAVRQLILNY